MRFQIIDAICVIECNLKCLEETGLTEQADSRLVHSRRETRIYGDWYGTLQINNDVGKVGKNVRAAYTRRTFKRRPKRIYSKRLRERTRKHTVICTRVNDCATR